MCRKEVRWKVYIDWNMNILGGGGGGKMHKLVNDYKSDFQNRI